MTDMRGRSGWTDRDHLLDDAAVYALDACDPHDRAAVRRARAHADPADRELFDTAVAEHRETLSRIAVADAVPAPPGLLTTIWDRIDGAPTPGAQTDGAAVTALADRRGRWTAGLAAAAAAAVLVVGGFAVGTLVSGDQPAPLTGSSAVVDAPDVRTTVAEVAGGSATVLYSRQADAAVLVMNDIPAPAEGTVYQLWLLGPDDPAQAVGMMGPDDVAPSTQALVDRVDTATALGISVEPPGGSPAPSDLVAQIPLG